MHLCCAVLRCLRIDREVRPSRHALPGASVRTFEKEIFCRLTKHKRHDHRIQPCSDVFTCRICGWPIGPEGAGSQHRNHCPNCLSSVHLDDEPGDHSAECGGTMEPMAVWVRKTASGRLSTAVKSAASSIPTRLPQMAARLF